uniref:Putative LOC100203442 [Hydra vulgaris] n=1 Tax=Lepeophtheirus salmonis TaxID=72036 RepID=A0A0K2TVU1_LEPSM
MEETIFCEKYIESLWCLDNEFRVDYALIKQKDCGGLHQTALTYPSKDVIEVCLETEKMFERLLNSKNRLAERFQPDS